MKPLKSKDLIPEVANELGLPIYIVDAIVKEYWKDVWENLTSLSAPKVHIENLGDFNIKYWLLDKEIQKCEGFLTSPRTKDKIIAGLKIKDRINLLENIKDEIDKENQRKEFIYEHKKVTREINTDMEKQKTDISRTIF